MEADILEAAVNVEKRVLPRDLSTPKGAPHQMADKIRKIMSFPKTVARKFPAFDRVYKTITAKEEMAHAIDFDIRTAMTPYFGLSKTSRAKVNKAAIKLRNLNYTWNPQAAGAFGHKQGLSPKEIGALKALKKGADVGMDHFVNVVNSQYSDRLDSMRKRNAPTGDIQEVEVKRDELLSQIQSLKKKFYVPFARSKGNYMVWVLPPKGSTVSEHFEVAPTMARAKAKANELGRRYPNSKVEYGEYRQGSSEMFKGLDPITLLFANELENSMAKSSGVAIPDHLSLTKRIAEAMHGMPFSTRFLKTEFVPGFNEDIGENIVRYSQGLGNYLANRQHQTKIAKELKAIGSGRPGLLEYANWYSGYNMSNHEEFAQVRSFLFYWYLGGNIKSAIVNLSQNATVGLPLLRKYTKGAAKKYGKAARLAKKTVGNIDALQSTDPELHAAMKSALRRGVLTDRFMQELTGGVTEGKKRNVVLKGARYLFSSAETFNRHASYIAAYQAARNGVRIDGKTRRMDPTEAASFAEEFTLDVNFRYGKADRPKVATKVGAPFMTFRLFTGNYLSLMKRLAQEKDYATLGRMTLAMSAIAGTMGIPGMGLAFQLASALLGSDLEDEARRLGVKLVGKKFSKVTADAFFGGLPQLLGADLSGSIGLGQVIPEFGHDDPLTYTAKLAGGVPVDAFVKLQRALRHVSKGKPGRALEQFMPEAIRNPFVAARWITDREKDETGTIRGSLDQKIGNVSIKDLILKSASIQPSRATKAYKAKESQFKIVEKVRTATSEANRSMARAILRDDKRGQAAIGEKVRRWNEKARKADRPEMMIRLSKSSIREYISRAGGGVPRYVPTRVRRRWKEIQELYGVR
jgi:hypothetical protein